MVEVALVAISDRAIAEGSSAIVLGFAATINDPRAGCDQEVVSFEFSQASQSLLLAAQAGRDQNEIRTSKDIVAASRIVNPLGRVP